MTLERNFTQNLICRYNVTHIKHCRVDVSANFTHLNERNVRVYHT